MPQRDASEDADATGLHGDKQGHTLISPQMLCLPGTRSLTHVQGQGRPLEMKSVEPSGLFPFIPTLPPSRRLTSATNKPPDRLAQTRLLSIRSELG